MQVSGWIETENGEEMFDYTATNIRGIAKALLAEFGDDAGATDMEATDQDGTVARHILDQEATGLPQ